MTPLQLNEIVQAALSNNQVTWIVSDPDIYEFLKNVTAGHHNEIEENNLNEFQALMRKAEIKRKEDAAEPLF